MRRQAWVLAAIPFLAIFVAIVAPYPADIRAAITHNHGVALLAKGDTDAAIADFNEALRLDPHRAMSLYARASAYRNKSDIGAAEADIDAAIRLDPKCTEAYIFRGDLALLKGDFDRAITNYQAALAIDPINSQAKRQLETAKAARATSR